MSEQQTSRPYSAVSGIQHEEPLLFEHTHEAPETISLPGVQGELATDLKTFLRQQPAEIPGLSEPEAVRHFVRMSQWNHSIETGFYPLGSCTMKYNPRVNEQVVRLLGLAHIHPDQPIDSVQGVLMLLHEVQQWLCEITGFADATLQPAAGAHGELTGMMMIRACLDARGQQHRNKVLVPDSAHGTNPSSATLCGMHPVTLKSGPDGHIDLEELKNGATP